MNGVAGELPDNWRELLAAAVEATLAGGAAVAKIYGVHDPEVSYKEDRSPLTAADKASHEAIVRRLGACGLPLLSEEGAAIPYTTRARRPLLWLVDPLDGTKEFIKRNGEFTVNVALVSGGKPVLGVVYAPAKDDLYIGAHGIGAWRARGVAGAAAGARLVAQCAAGEFDAPLERLGAAPAAPPTLRVVASRSHGSPATDAFIAALARYGRPVERVSSGSSLKLCMVATGEALVYPRLAPTMEWDTAAAQAVVTAAGGRVVVCDPQLPAAFAAHGAAALVAAAPLEYNRQELLNPWFVVYHPLLERL